MNRSIADIRKDYQLQRLLETDVAADPFTQFDHWWADALKSEIDEVNAMTLATASADAVPDARIVLLKSYSEKGFIFFTNYNSTKGKELAENPKACLVFFWKELERQVRILGDIEKVSDTESDAYFQSRPFGSRIGAWASPQSSVIGSRDVIEANITKYEQQFTEANIKRPPHWGGYVLVPTRIEFWQGRPNRLHDRIRYALEADSWRIERLAP